MKRALPWIICACLAPACARDHPPRTPADAEPALGELHVVPVPSGPRPEGEIQDSEASAALPGQHATSLSASSPRATRASSTSSAPQAKLTAAERRLRERIQRTLLARRSLSFTAKYLRVDVRGRDVTLRGRARTEGEKHEVQRLVERIDGVRRVDNQLAIID
jgi:hypothetical protein